MMWRLEVSNDEWISGFIGSLLYVLCTMEWSATEIIVAGIARLTAPADSRGSFVECLHRWALASRYWLSSIADQYEFQMPKNKCRVKHLPTVLTSSQMKFVRRWRPARAIAETQLPGYQVWKYSSIDEERNHNLLVYPGSRSSPRYHKPITLHWSNIRCSPLWSFQGYNFGHLVETQLNRVYNFLTTTYLGNQNENGPCCFPNQPPKCGTGVLFHLRLVGFIIHFFSNVSSFR